MRRTVICGLVDEFIAFIVGNVIVKIESSGSPLDMKQVYHLETFAIRLGVAAFLLCTRRPGISLLAIVLTIQKFK